MRKILFSIVFMLPILFSCSDEKETIYIESIKLESNDISIVEGESKKIDYKVLPENASDKELVWKSSNENILKVEDGTINAIKAGNCKITAEAKNGVKEICSVTVTEKVIPLESIAFDVKDVEIDEEDSYILEITYTPKNATNKNIEWKSTDLSIAYCIDGLIRGKSEGKCVITGTTEDGGHTATVNVTVIKPVIPISGLSFEDDRLDLKVGDKTKLKINFTPEDTTEKDVKFSSSKPEIVSVDEEGMIECKATGICIITVESEDGALSDTIVISVDSADEEIFCTDPDGRKYKTIKIGEQIWMAENYAYLPKVDNYTDETRVEARCYVFEYAGTDLAEAKENENYKKYGALYNWQAAKDLAPEGWHLPTDEEWKEMERSLGMPEKEVNGIYRHGTFGTKLKSTEGWDKEEDGLNGTNDFGFNGVSAGGNGQDLMYIYPGVVTYYWTKTTEDSGYFTQAFARRLFCTQESVLRYKYDIIYGFSVRYVKDK